MNRMMLMQAAGAIVLAMLVCVALLLPRLRRADRMQGRIAALRGLARQNRPEAAPLPQRMARAVGQAVLASGIVKGETLAELQRTVTAAGFRGARAVTVFIGTKVMLMVGLPFLALPLSAGMAPMGRNLLVAGAAVAGLPLEAAVERVATEMAEANRAVAAEFGNVGTELRILSDRRQALQNMGDRSGLDSLRRLGGTLAQTLQYGTPLSQALRTLATELRHETLMRFEARAARLPALLTMPTIAFILPCIFLIVGGPAVLRVLDIAARP